MNKTYKKFRSYIYKMTKQCFLRFLPDASFISVDYFLNLVKFLHPDNPVTFAEKLQWIKIHHKLETYTNYVDKYTVRKLIAKTIGKKYLIPLYGVWSGFDEIDFDKLPRQFVLKATHGSHYIYICRDKRLMDKMSVKDLVTVWIRENFYMKTREIQYKDCVPRILAEKYLENIYGELIDYRVFCFNGHPKFIGVGTEKGEGEDFMDLHWKKLPILSLPYPNVVTPFPKPDNLKELINVAKKLSKGFPFVRVDVYSVHNRAYFGELTFTPANGMQWFKPDEVNYTLGRLIDLKKY